MLTSPADTTASPFDPQTLLVASRLGVLATIRSDGRPRVAAGEHPDWDEYRSVMVSDRRVLMVMTVDNVYGATIA